VPSLEKSYLNKLDTWSETLAGQLAAAEGIQLTDDHLEILHLARAFFDEYGFSPSMRPLLKYTASHLDIRKGRSIYMMQLFPPSPARVAAKIAGLPKPKDCL